MLREYIQQKWQEIQQEIDSLNLKRPQLFDVSGRGIDQLHHSFREIALADDSSS